MVSKKNLEENLEKNLKKNSTPSPEKIVILTGPTATGKSRFAFEFAQTRPEIEIINADSLLIYRGMDIGTAKPLPTELAQVPHHLVNIRDPSENFTAGDFVRTTEAAILDIQARGKRVLIAGGSGFYLKALLFGLWDTPPSDPHIKAQLQEYSNEELFRQLHDRDPNAADKIGKNDRYRLVRALEILQLTGKTPSNYQDTPRPPDPRFSLYLIDRPTSELFQRVNERTQQMLEDGIIAEYQRVRRDFPKCRPLLSVGYAQVGRFLADVSPPGRKIRSGIDGLNDEIQLATRQLIKSQRTWFKGQCEALAQTRKFQLDEELPVLEEAMKSVYE